LRWARDDDRQTREDDRYEDEEAVRKNTYNAFY
jgi:hypothetical protein